MKHLPYVIMIAALCVWAYELRQDHAEALAGSDFWYRSMKNAENRVNDQRRELHQIRASCERDI